jgi:hypothetical protein
MKKLSLYIISILIITNLFVPFGIVINGKGSAQINKSTVSADDCVVLSAIWVPAGEQNKDTFYRDGKTAANIKVKTKNCTDKSDITLTVFEADTCGINCDDALQDSHLLRRPLDIPTDNFTMRIRLGEEECEAGLTGAIGYDCDLFFYIRQGDNVLYNSAGETDGHIYYECDGLCLDNAVFLSLTPDGNDDNPVVNVDPTTQTPVIDQTYKLLAPIGTLTEVKTSTGLGDYLNIIFKMGIGICAALAVIMIVIGGIQYMGEESVFGKTEAKGKIMAAILGLFIALGAFAILNTINPALTGQNGVTVDQVDADIVVRDRADDPDFMSNIDSFDTSNITITPSSYGDSAFIGYLGHQQGVAGASAILWSAKKGYTSVPTNNPFTKANINRNMQTNFNPTSAQNTIGTSVLTPNNFLKYWATKMEAAKKKTSPQIPSFIDTELNKVSTETGVGITELRAVCRIESAGGCTSQASVTTVNSYGYSGLFQLSRAVFDKYKKASGIILNAYDNAFAAAQYFKVNLTGINNNSTKING